MSGVGFKRFARVAIFFACACSLQFCFLNPQPEPPENSKGRPSGGTGGSGGATGGGGAGGILADASVAVDSGIPPINPGAADVRADTGGIDAGADGPGEDALPPDDDAPSLDADVSGDDAPSLDADAAGEDADAPGGDAPGADVDDAQGEPGGASDGADADAAD